MDYEALVHYNVKHSKNEFANNHINGIENFLLHLQECEFRYIKTAQKLVSETIKINNGKYA